VFYSAGVVECVSAVFPTNMTPGTGNPSIIPSRKVADDPLGTTLASHNPVFWITSVLPMSHRESPSPMQTDERRRPGLPHVQVVGNTAV